MRLTPVFLSSLVVTLFAAVLAPADVVYMKDGFRLDGKVRREATLIIDPLNGQAIPVFKGSHFFIMDDKVRWVIFNHRGVENVEPDINVRSDFVELQNPSPGGQSNKLPGSARLERITPLDDHWQRAVFLSNELGRYTIKQRLTSLSPYAARLESNSYQWNVFYLTKEFSIDEVKKLLDSHPGLKEESGPNADVRLKRFRFLLQGDWLTAANEELDRALKDLPKDDKDVASRLDRAKAALKQTQVRDIWEELQTADRAGRYRFVRERLAQLVLEKLDDRVAVEVSALKSKYDGWDRQTQDLERSLDVVNGRFVGPPSPLVAEAEAAIREGVGPETLDRLEPFLTLATQYERELKEGKTPTTSPADLFALAVTGWLMGRESAEAKVATMERYWASEKFLAAYLRAKDAAEQARLFADYRNRGPLSLDEVSQLIALAPPPEPVPRPAGPAATGVEERRTQLPWTQARPVNYHLRLPPEYRPTRSYPVIVTLHGAGERPEVALARWADDAARHGYIVAAPDWGGTAGYHYSADEHLIVTELVRDLRRHYAVDSDRVFLTGYGDGGTMAFDVGLSHPDLFAGVIPVNAAPRRSTVAWYWHNAQNLPFYIVVGELAGECVSLNRWPFENWMSRGYPSLMTIYKGRPMEQFLCETPTVFDWMNRKRRSSGFPELGRNANSMGGSEDFQSMREVDNRFYWVSIEQINSKNVNHDIGMKIGTPAAFTAAVRDGNSVYVNARGIKTLRLWFGRIWDAQTGWRPMIDFAKPVKVTVNGRTWGKERTVQPSLQTMLDDLYQRGDRQRMFLAYIDLEKLQ
jgi:pimeloyl-ACP methyl ester carboxylesterase